jgi:hypothetical protein
MSLIKNGFSALEAMLVLAVGSFMAMTLSDFLFVSDNNAIPTNSTKLRYSLESSADAISQDIARVNDIKSAQEIGERSYDFRVVDNAIQYNARANANHWKTISNRNVKITALTLVPNYRKIATHGNDATVLDSVSVTISGQLANDPETSMSVNRLFTYYK